MKNTFYQLKKWSIGFVLSAMLASCEQEFTPVLPANEEQIVVEGYIEAGDRPTPPLVILTKSLAFFKTFSTNSSNLFVHDAVVWLSTGNDSVQLREICWSTLDSATKRLIAPTFNINLDSISANFDLCVYVDITQRIRPEVGKTYTLRIQKDGKNLWAKTTIPRLVRMDSAAFLKPPGTNVNDTLVQMRGTITDPAGEKNFYRYFTSVNQSVYQAGQNSVIDDSFFDGKLTTFNLQNTAPNRSTRFGEFGLFRKGDTISIKYCTLDESHYNFWNTLEFNNNNQGPFASYTRVKFNVVGEGGIGIWGGYAVTYFDRIIPK